MRAVDSVKAWAGQPAVVVKVVADRHLMHKIERETDRCECMDVVQYACFCMQWAALWVAGHACIFGQPLVRSCA